MRLVGHLNALEVDQGQDEEDPAHRRGREVDQDVHPPARGGAEELGDGLDGDVAALSGREAGSQDPDPDHHVARDVVEPGHRLREGNHAPSNLSQKDLREGQEDHHGQGEQTDPDLDLLDSAV